MHRNTFITPRDVPRETELTCKAVSFLNIAMFVVKKINSCFEEYAKVEPSKYIPILLFLEVNRCVGGLGG